MAFDWFRRKKKAEPEQESQKAPDVAPSSKTQPAREPETQATPAPASSEDYLAFAKAAYANLKTKEATTVAPSAPAPSPAVAPPSLPELPATPKVAESPEPVAEAPAAVDPAPETDELNPEIATVDSPEAIAPEPVAAQESAIAPEPTTEQLTELAATATASAEPSAPKAFFEMAPKASERLEVLEAEALEEPEPAVEAPEPSLQAPAATTYVPDFDDGFVWSAEVLASQGRGIEEITVEEITWLQKLRRGLGKTRLSLINQLKGLVGKGPINDEAVEEIEALLLQADVGISATDRIVEALQNRMRDEVLPPEEAVSYLKQLLREILSVGEPSFAPQEDGLNIWLMVGVNGAGKTTTLGKIANLAQKSGYKVLVAAADTFRAAAVEQVKVWCERAGVEAIANPGQNTDPAAVVFDAIAAARSRNVDLLLVDTAGRLQNKKNLMDELTKIRRIVDKKAPDAKVESLLVLDATLGQNGLRQAQVFSEAANLSGVVLTKLDGTAKGGVALAVANEMKLPIRFIGVGEGLEDLRPFSSYEFVEALVSEY
ncbi:signal recognition particle-docking protein FtsY [Synechococcus sp. PCC 7336]|uniref:signal recognition particle-docking protein FtsY n=1 Tax=Synechococcus sp. PCC 7336 TaxID=195250 RepID=UPI00034B36A5|nr:signal recognition particle-docking protein FtsY [Synechococcus sp. PCC 7336]